jgi:O-succinylbenzoic acid--CoA ligase
MVDEGRQPQSDHESLPPLLAHSPPPSLPLSLPRAARVRPAHAALLMPGREQPHSLSYAGLEDLAAHLARQMAGLGVRKGDRVAALLPDGPRFVALYHALPRLGAVLVPLNTRLTPDELAWQVADADPRMVVHECAWAGKLEAVSAKVRRIRYPAFDSRGSDLAPANLDGAERAQDRIALAGLLGVEPDEAQDLLDELPTVSPRVIVYTSGTTGRPKGALLSHGNLIFSAMGSALRLGVSPEDRWLAPLPLFHVGGMAILERSALQASTVVLPRRFEAKGIAALLESESITQVSMVPTMLSRVMKRMDDENGVPPSSLRTVLLGGGPISSEMYARALEQGFPVAPTYGLSEAASQVATAAPGMVESGEQVAAPAMPFAEIAIEDADGRPSRASGTTGEILVRGATVMQGYWRNPEASERALRGGWLHTGDLGKLDARGWLVPLGRRHDLVVSGGENVYPAEVEAFLATHPDVAACCVLGVADPEWGQRVVAAVELEAFVTMDAPGLEAHLRKALAGYKIPRVFVAFEALPRSAAGKILRARVAEAMETKIGELGA